MSKIYNLVLRRVITFLGAAAGFLTFSDLALWTNGVFSISSNLTDFGLASGVDAINFGRLATGFSSPKNN